MTATLPILALVTFVGVAVYTAQAVLTRAAAQAQWDADVADAMTAADWADDPTPTYDALLADVRHLPLVEAIGAVMAADVEAWVGEQQ